MTPDDNIEKLSREILQQAESEAATLISEAKSKAEEIKKRAQEEAASEKNRIISQAKRDSDRIRSQAVATTQLKSRTMELEAREKLLTQVLTEAMHKLPTVQQWNDYDAIVEKLALEAIAQIGSKKIIIHADKITNKILADSVLKKINSKFEGEVELGAPLQKGTGLIVATENEHLNFDNSLENRLSRLENELRSPVYHLLMGEGL